MLCPCLADGLHSGLAVATGWISCLWDVSHLNVMCHVSAGMRWPIDQSYAKKLRANGLCADEIRMHSCTKRGCVPKKLCADELCANELCANEAVCRKSDSAMYKKKHRDSVDAACGSRVGPFSKLQLEANGNGSTEQADGVGQRAGRRSRPTGRPTE